MIGFVFTNFNNSLLTIQCIKSILKIKELVNFKIIVVDNNSNKNEVQILMEGESFFNHKDLHVIYNSTNIGYFKGLNKGLKYLRRLKMEFNFIVVGNNDLLFHQNFFISLNINKNKYRKYPVICPNIITLDGIHQNPHVLYKVSKPRKLIYYLYFSNYKIASLLFKISIILGSKTKRKDTKSHETSSEVVQGYGACYILTDLFIKRFKYLHAPVFLMGEEYFLSHQVRSKNYTMFYDANILIYHIDHATVGDLISFSSWDTMRRSFFIYRRYI